MNPRLKTDVGSRWGMLVVVGNVTRVGLHLQCECACDCGAVLYVRTSYLGRGKRSCGCERRVRGGESRTSREYRAWQQMRHQSAWSGAYVWPAWADLKGGYMRFRADVGEWREGTRCQRIVLSDGWVPGNVAWVGWWRGCEVVLGKTVLEWSKSSGLAVDVISDRLRRRKWDPLRAVTQPAKVRGKNGEIPTAARSGVRLFLR